MIFSISIMSDLVDPDFDSNYGVVIVYVFFVRAIDFSIDKIWNR